MKIRCNNGEIVMVKKGEEFMPNHVKDFEEALKECHIEEKAWIPYPTRSNNPNGGIGVFSYNDYIFITNNNTISEVVIDIDKKDNIERLYKRVSKKLLQDVTSDEREDMEKVLNRLKDVLGVR